MDARVRAAERRWRSSPGDLEALDALRVECARAGGDLPDDAVRALPRWQRLQGFARKWRDRPLGARDGLPLAKVLAREKQLGFRLPASLREWYRLVGGVLRARQDTPVKLGELCLDDGLLVFFVENQACFHWAVLEEHLHDDDPPVHGGRNLQRPEHIAGHLSELLFAKVLCEAVFADGEHPSTIGPLRKGVCGGYFDADGSADDVVAERYSRLPVVSTGWTGEETVLHGDADTIVQVEGSGYGFGVARTPEAWAVLEGLGFRPSGI